jgi:NADH-quinone oxidoreductase subunit G
MKPMVIFGAGAFARPDGAAILSLAAKAALSLGVVKDEWNGFNVLQSAASRVGGLDIGFTPGERGLDALAMAKAGALDLVFNLGADEIVIEPGAFVVYIGTHGDRGAHRADVILPGAAYPEKTGIYVNTEGRPQFGDRATYPPGQAREDWAILRALSDALGARLPFDSLTQLRAAMNAAHPHLGRLDEIAPADASVLSDLASLGGAFDKAPFISPIEDFYLTNPIVRASKVMAECSAMQKARALKAAE